MENLTTHKMQSLKLDLENDTFQNQINELIDAMSIGGFEVDEEEKIMGSLYIDFVSHSNQVDCIIDPDGIVSFENLQFGEVEELIENIISYFNRFS
jgi:hypothetical protein